jgi:hypothetical protein
MLKNKLIHIFLSLLVFVYIIFEELVWETLAKPIYEFIHSLKLLKKLELFIKKLNPFIVLVIFIALFIQVELLGIFAVALLAKGAVLTSVLLYSAKIPIGAFTFWLFKVSKDKLLTFGWFKASYEFILKWIEKIKQTQTYKNVKVKTTTMKKYIKRNFLQNSGLKVKIKRIYKKIKAYFV